VQTPAAPEMVRRDVFGFLSSIPSSTYIYAMLASIAASAYLYLTGRRHTALFVGQWAPTFLAIGLFSKLLRPSGEGIPERVREAFERATR
jgi:hypothetical protein